MTRRTRAAARAACLAFLLAATPAFGADEAAVERCFELRDDDPAAAVAEPRAALASPPAPDPEIEIKLGTCLARSLALTGLLNRRAATARLQRETAAAAEDGQRQVVFLIDIDHFKARNDTHGHAAGDAALAAVARELRAWCRPDDIVARWGGEEFLVGCRHLDLEEAQQVAERLRTAAAVAAVPAGRRTGDSAPAPLTVSIGFACLPFFPGDRSPGDWQDAVALADRALYAAKHSGRDAWVGMWGTEEGEAAIEAVIADPEAHAARGDIIVAGSRAQVRWHSPAAEPA